MLEGLGICPKSEERGSCFNVVLWGWPVFKVSRTQILNSCPLFFCGTGCQRKDFSYGPKYRLQGPLDVDWSNELMN